MALLSQSLTVRQAQPSIESCRPKVKLPMNTLESAR